VDGKTAGVAGLDAINRVVDVIFNYLARAGSPFVRARFSGVSLGSPAEMPYGFRGMVDDTAYAVSGGIRHSMQPLPDYAMVSDTAGTPLFYYFSGDDGDDVVMHTSPPASAGFTLDGWYYQHPGELQMFSRLPWNGSFDRQIESAVLAMVQGAEDISLVENEVTKALSVRKSGPSVNKLW
jgi:hypothetical protein